MKESEQALFHKKVRLKTGKWTRGKRGAAVRLPRGLQGPSFTDKKLESKGQQIEIHVALSEKLEPRRFFVGAARKKKTDERGTAE